MRYAHFFVLDARTARRARLGVEAQPMGRELPVESR
jgi:hypothetical protein